MMKLKLPQLDDSTARGKATKALLQTHEILVAHHAELVKNKVFDATLDEADLDELGVDPSLRDSVVFGTELVGWLPQNVIKPTWQFERKRMVGFGADAFSSALYGSDEIKGALIKTHASRCAYCESYLRHVSHGDVEHFRPKAGCVDSSFAGLNREAYFWLAYQPFNLLLACQLCNQVYKGNLFPVLGDRLPPGEMDVTKEKPVFIDPYREEPRDHIRFDPRNGQAYPFGLYAAAIGSKEGAQELFWRTPEVIGQLPGSTKFQQWSSTQTDGSLSRGLRTIKLLGLNRPELVRARVAHLRHLRALLWTQFHGLKADDVAEAKKLCANLLATNVNLVVEYQSLTIDALTTWMLRARNKIEPRVVQREPNTIDTQVVTDPWIPTYDKLLSEFAHVPPTQPEADPSTYNDAIAYFVPTKDAKLTKARRLVYITDKKTYGVGAKEGGYYLAVDWSEKRKVVRVFTRTRKKAKVEVTEEIDLASFLEFSPQGMWRKFNNCHVHAVGPFPPIL